MALPKIQVPTTKFKSLDGVTEYLLRPFSVKEQKILLTAKEEMKNETDPKKNIRVLLHALEQVLGNCILNHDINDVHSFDFPFLMLKIRTISVDNVSALSYRCTSDIDGEECGSQFTINVNLDSIESQGEYIKDKKDRCVRLDDDFSISMKYPKFREFKMIYEDEDIDDIKALRLFLDFVYDNNGDGVYLISESTDEELEDFIVDIGPKIKSVQDWIRNVPKPYLKITHTCKKCSKEKVIELKEIEDFF